MGPDSDIAVPRARRLPHCRMEEPISGKALGEKGTRFMIPTLKPEHRSLARMIVAIASLAGVLAFLAFPVLAQSDAGSPPENAHARSYGGSWDCDLGYRMEDVECVKIEVPENAYATKRSYGAGWTCLRGYKEVDGASCIPIPVPANAFLKSSGYDWECLRGYRREGDTCVSVVLPEHSYLSDSSWGPGWACDRGFTASGDRCIPIVVPKNGYLTNADYGDAWACERGFVQVGDQCDPVVPPKHAFHDPMAYGPGWRCERGYEPDEQNSACIAIDLPENAHLDDSGNRWRCNPGFQLGDKTCLREQ